MEYTQEQMTALLIGYNKRWPNLSIDISVFNGDYRKGIVGNVLNLSSAAIEALILIGRDTKDAQV
jgi:hypothetical protein